MNEYWLKRGLVLFVGTLSMATAGSWRQSTSARDGVMVHLPQGANRPTSGLTVQLSWEGVGELGLRPVHVTFRSGRGPFSRDREIRVDVASVDYAGVGEFLASKSIRLTAGDMTAIGTILVPQHLSTDQAQIAVFENGRRLRDLSTTDPVSIRAGPHSWRRHAPSILVVDFDALPRRSSGGNRRETLVNDSGDEQWLGSESGEPGSRHLPDIRALIREASIGVRERDGDVIKPHDFSDEPSDGKLLHTVRNIYNANMIHPTDIHDDWIALSAIDVIVARFAELQVMKRDHPKKWAAVRTWADAGGNLFVYDCGVNDRGDIDLERIERHFDLSSPDIESEEVESEEVESAGTRGASPHWQRPMKLDSRYFNPQDGDGLANTDEALVPGRAFFVDRSLGLGKLAVTKEAYPFPGESRQWATLLNRFSTAWSNRFGLSLDSHNPGYWNFILAGFGLAPVNSFRVMIVLFAIVIGPLNYFVLRRANRLSWLFMTVPAGAFVATIGLLTFAIATDGFGVRYRVRSLTHIDQSSGFASTWSRQVYYAGIAPSGGLVFPIDTLVLPIVQNPMVDFRAAPRRVDWLPQQQVLSGGYAQSRAMSQFLVVRSRPTPLRLDVDLVSESNRIAVTNHLGATIRYLYLVGQEESAFEAFDTDLRPGDSTTLTKSPNASESRSRLLTLLNEHPLRLPPGMDDSDFDSYSTNFTSYTRYNERVSAETSVLETKLRRIATLDLDSHTYVAFVDSCGEVPIGTEGTEQESLYVIMGTWP